MPYETLGNPGFMDTVKSVGAKVKSGAGKVRGVIAEYSPLYKSTKRAIEETFGGGKGKKAGGQITGPAGAQGGVNTKGQPPVLSAQINLQPQQIALYGAVAVMLFLTIYFIKKAND